MKILVLNGSPKGEQSVTMQYVQYLALCYPQHEFSLRHVAHRVRSLERHTEQFAELIAEVRQADLVLWAFPLYILLVCSQYKRFIELIAERGAGDAFRDRYAASLSTSINYYDTTAHRYIQAVSEDLGMKYLGSYSANMQDLMKPEERRRLEGFATDLFASIERGIRPARLYPPLAYVPWTFSLEAPQRRVPTDGRRVVVLTDARPEQASLLAMIRRFREALDGEVEIFNLHDVDIKGGCLGCLRCGAEYRCAYTGKDGFIEFYNEKLKRADVLVFAGAIVDRQLSWKWRQFFDRSFFNTHTPSLTGKQVAFLVSGPLGQLPDLRLVYEAWVELQRSHLAAFLSDEAESAEALEEALDGLAERLVRLAGSGYIRPQTFLGIAGMKIFRDDIWGSLRIVFRADHQAYNRLGVYDFPQKRLGQRFLNQLGYLVTGLPGIRRRWPSMIKKGMLWPYRRVLRSAAPEAGHGSGVAGRSRRPVDAPPLAGYTGAASVT
jgi:multimeric flavodoxin WrbA